MEAKVKNMLRLFLDSIRDYEHESGSAIYNDERSSEEFVDIFIDSEDAFDYKDIVSQQMPSEEDINLLTYYISKDRNINLPNIDTLCDMDDLFKEIYQANRRHDFGEAAKKGYRAVINKWLKQSQPKEGSDMKAKESAEDILRQLFRNFFIFHNEANLNTISIDAYFDEWYKTRSIMIESVLKQYHLSQMPSDDIGNKFVEWAEEYWGIKEAYEKPLDPNSESASWNVVKPYFSKKINELIKQSQPKD